jgi:hypothetical protein
LLSNKFKLVFALLSAVIICSGCKKSNEPPPYKLYEDKSQVIQVAKDVLGKDVAFANSGYYLSDSLKSIVAGIEVSEKNQFGIKFYLIDWVDGEFKEVYATEVMEGSFTKCLVDKIKFSDMPHELLYYNSQGYFLGSGGGEVYSHVVNFQAKETYTAHLTVASRGDIYLELSNNIKIPMLKTFFVSYFKREYPNLVVINSDSTPNI